jgi:hypothetical protein
VDTDLTLTDLSQPAFVSQLQAIGLSFSRIDEFRKRDETLIRHSSTIVSGTLYFEALDGLALSLRSGEVLTFERVAGVVRTLRLQHDDVALQFHGRVRGMRTGWGEMERSLMPTYLEWLKARHGLYLLWGSTLYCFGLIISLLRWWGIRL